MKNILKILLVLSLFSLSFAESARVIKIRNRAEKASTGGAWVKLRFGAQVYENETVKTYKDAKVVLVFQNKTKVFINENSCLTFAEIKKLQKNVRTDWGKFDFKVDTSDKASKFKVTTPVAVGGVEGTEFSVTVDKETGETQFLLFSGVLNVQGSEGMMGRLVLTPNQMVKINENTAMLIPEEIPKDKRNPEFLQESKAQPQGGGSQPADQAAATQPAGDQKAQTETGVEAEDRLYQSGQNASGGFIPENSDERKEEVINTPPGAKTKSKVIVEIQKQ